MTDRAADRKADRAPAPGVARGRSIPPVFRRLVTRERLRFVKFAIVGATGVVVNEIVLWLCYQWLLTDVTGPANEALSRLLAFGGPGAESAFFGSLAVGLFARYLPGSFVESDLLLGGNRLTWSGITAIGVSILTNFLLNDVWTWGDREKRGRRHFFVRLGQYYVVASIAGVVQWTVLKVLTESFGVHYLMSNLVGILAGLAINFVANNLWTFRAVPE